MLLGISYVCCYGDCISVEGRHDACTHHADRRHASYSCTDRDVTLALALPLQDTARHSLLALT